MDDRHPGDAYAVPSQQTAPPDLEPVPPVVPPASVLIAADDPQPFPPPPPPIPPVLEGQAPAGSAAQGPRGGRPAVRAAAVLATALVVLLVGLAAGGALRRSDDDAADGSGGGGVALESVDQVPGIEDGGAPPSVAPVGADGLPLAPPALGADGLPLAPSGGDPGPAAGGPLAGGTDTTAPYVQGIGNATPVTPVTTGAGTTSTSRAATPRSTTTSMAPGPAVSAAGSRLVAWTGADRPYNKSCSALGNDVATCVEHGGVVAVLTNVSGNKQRVTVFTVQAGGSVARPALELKDPSSVPRATLTPADLGGGPVVVVGLHLGGRSEPLHIDVVRLAADPAKAEAVVHREHEAGVADLVGGAIEAWSGTAAPYHHEQLRFHAGAYRLQVQDRRQTKPTTGTL